MLKRQRRLHQLPRQAEGQAASAKGAASLYRNYKRRLDMDSNIIVMVVTLIIWIGVFFYLKNIDSKVSRLEDKS